MTNDDERVLLQQIIVAANTIKVSKEIQDNTNNYNVEKYI